MKKNYSSLSTELATVKRNYSLMGGELSTLRRNYTSTQTELITLQGNYSSLQNEFASLNNSNTNLEQTVTSLQTQSGTLEKQQEETMSNMSAKLKELSDEQGILKENYTCLENDFGTFKENVLSNEAALVKFHNESAHLKALLENDVAFEAVLSGTKSHSMDSSTVMKFTAVRYNEGKGFNPTTGYFTAPVSGTYVFWVSCVFTGRKISVIIINRNGATVGFSYGFEPGVGSLGITSGISVFSLDKRDRVHFSPNAPVNITGNVSSYGGALIRSKT